MAPVQFEIRQSLLANRSPPTFFVVRVAEDEESVSITPVDGSRGKTYEECRAILVACEAGTYVPPEVA